MSQATRFATALALADAVSGTLACGRASRAGTLLGSIADYERQLRARRDRHRHRPGHQHQLDHRHQRDGFYTFPNLKDGIYRVEAELAGFKKVVRENVRVDVNTTIRVDLTLEVGAITEVAHGERRAAVAADRSQPTPGASSRAKQIERPCRSASTATSRAWWSRCRARRGRSATHSEFFNSQDSLSIEVNGQSRLANNTMIEGVDDNQKTGLLPVIIPAADALETVSVTTSNYDAEFGRSGGAITNVTLKSGTNQLQGQRASSSATTRRPTPATTSSHLPKAPSQVHQPAASRSAARSSATSCSSSATTCGPSTISAASSAPSSRPRRCATATSARSAQHIYDPLTGDVNGNGRARSPAT